jgi:hypothetical protein
MVGVVIVQHVQAWICLCSNEANSYKEHIKGAVPGQWGLSQAIEHSLQSEDMAWTVRVNEPFWLCNIHLLMQVSLQEGVVNVNGVHHIAVLHSMRE